MGAPKLGWAGGGREQGGSAGAKRGSQARKKRSGEEGCSLRGVGAGLSTGRGLAEGQRRSRGAAVRPGAGRDPRRAPGQAGYAAIDILGTIGRGMDIQSNPNGTNFDEFF